MNRIAPLLVVAAAGLEAACTPRPELHECDVMPVKGWEQLVRSDAFASLANTKDLPYESVYGTSRMFLADSNYNYDTLLTFTFLHPSMAQGRPDERCVHDVSLLVHEPVEGQRAALVAALLRFLKSQGVPEEITQSIEKTRERKADFAPVGTIRDGAIVSAGFVDHGARGRFFEVEVRSSP